MDCNISNVDAKESINNCWAELMKIEHLIVGMGSTANPVPYLVRYSIIKSCGTIEYSFKTIICDHKFESHSLQVQNFIDEKFRKSSMNPSYENIMSGLKSFDIRWRDKFKTKINAHHEKNMLIDSLKSLNTARNTFAHGNNPSASFSNVKEYFRHSVEILQVMESSILEAEEEDQEAIAMAEAEAIAEAMAATEAMAEAEAVVATEAMAEAEAVAAATSATEGMAVTTMHRRETPH
ncbi:HEPN domain-containing protein [Serratia proteamaculans]|uniref:HEPN domain-containing protein n=1 Tax=Serratia proteamaculans TaxID=28151 RepID=UPI0021843BEC|nr:HEPN domain-containing protein [Serratia proteamaculans]CAI2440107.1 Uncharacterised protein [Serratia proteamaculans]